MARGKIIVTTAKNIIQEPQKQNIILHLKCKCSDINNIYNINYIQSQNNNNNVLPFNNTDSEELKIPDYKEKNISENYNDTQDNNNINTELWKKIKSLSSSQSLSILVKSLGSKDPSALNMQRYSVSTLFIPSIKAFP